ncbi:tigger transposable element-derived protein 1-like [Scylla paramamosain]|uniref:tigger transposable element-derived protein 1-like n=1 Tax=Scylla paramamosain TaxID=85552 RepID=UPI0030828C2B
MEKLLLVWLMEKQLASDTVTEGIICEKQVFNCDETGLFWKKMPRTYIRAKEKKKPGHKSMKDRLTLTLCANVIWRANPKAWVTREFFVVWVNLIFGSAIKKYLQKSNLPLQAFIILHNAPAHPPNLKDNSLKKFKFKKVVYLPANTTPILHPMDQQVIPNFKKLFTKHLFRCCFEMTENINLTLREFWKDHYNIVICLRINNMAWQDVTKRTLTSAWKKLWPEVVSKRDFDRFNPEVAVVEIVSLGKSMGLELDEGDMNKLIEEHPEELMMEEFNELQKQQHT